MNTQAPTYSGKMTAASFLTIMQQKGGVVAGNIYCGIYKDMPYYTNLINGSKSNAVFQLRIKFEEKVGSLFKALKNQFAGNIKLINIATGGQNLAVNIRVNGLDNFSQTVDHVLETIWSCSRNMGLTVPHTCTVCGNPQPDSYALYGDAYTTVHASCIEHSTTKQVEKADLNEIDGNYALGVIGAVIGGIVGMIPTVLLMYFGNLISAWLCALIPLGAYFGYKLLKGKMNGVATAVTLIVSILLVPVLDYIVSAIQVMSEFDFFISPLDYLAIFSESPSDFAPALIQELLFVGLGVLVVFSIVRKGNKHVYAEAQAVMTTVRPIGGVMPQSAAPVENVAPEYSPVAAAPASDYAEPRE